MCKIEPNCLPFEIIDKFLKPISFHLLFNSCAKELYLVLKNSFQDSKEVCETSNKEYQMCIIHFLNQ